MPSNFRTYEAQSRLLAAVIASNPSLKLNFKAIALHYGSDSTASGLEHRFRPIKKQAAAIRKAVAEGTDAKELQDMFLLSDKDIAKYFGESTPMGVEFQFRSIRKEAKALREAVDKGESPLSTRRATASPNIRVSTVEGSQRKRKAAASTAAVGTTQAVSKKRARTVETIFSNEEESVTNDANYDELDVTPVSTPVRGHGPSSVAPVSAAAPSFIDLAATTPTPTASFVPDATPALSVSATPTDESPDAVHDEFHTAPRMQGQYQNQNHQYQQHSQNHNQSTPRQAFLATYNMSHFDDDDDDDDDDDIFIIDTPSKAPKMVAGVSNTTTASSADVKPLALSPPQQHASSFATLSAGDSAGNSNELNDYSLGTSSWDNLSQEQTQSHSAFSFDSSDTWTQPDLFSASETVQSFTQETSFYDDDAAI